MSSLAAFREGLKRSLRYWQILVMLFIASLFSTLPFILVPALSLYATADRTAIQQAADGIDAWLIIESFAAQLPRILLEGETLTAPKLTQGVSSLLLFGLLGFAAAPLLAWVTSALFGGGILSAYVDAPHRFHWKRFFWSCWRGFGVFLLLGLLQGLLGLALFIPLGALTLVAGLYRLWLVGVFGPLLFLLWVVWLAMFEFSQVYTVARGDWKVWRAVAQAIRLMAHRPLEVAGLYALALLGLGMIHVLFRLGILANLPLAWWPVSALAQQGYILFRLWGRAARLAGGTALVMNEMEV